MTEIVLRPGDGSRATFWRQATPGSSYVRCELPARYLPGQVLRLRPSDLKAHPLNRDDTLFPRQRGRASIWQFSGEWVRGLLMAEQQEKGYRVLLEVDDNYLVLPPKFKGLNRQWNRTIAEDRGGYSAEANGRIARFADAVIASTEALGKVYRKLNPNVYVCPNQVDPDDWIPVEAPDDGVLRIVYAGSPSHQQDAPLVARALEWASKQPDVEVYSFGFRPDSWKFDSKVIPWTDSVEEFRQTLFGFDVGVAPLVETVWSRCKSDLKALEYAMAGVLPIVSATEPYRPWLNGPGLVAHTPKDFYHHVKWCVQNRDEVKSLAEASRDYVLAERTISQNVWRWEEAIHAS